MTPPFKLDEDYDPEGTSSACRNQRHEDRLDFGGEYPKHWYRDPHRLQPHASPGNLIAAIRAKMHATKVCRLHRGGMHMAPLRYLPNDQITHRGRHRLHRASDVDANPIELILGYHYNMQKLHALPHSHRKQIGQ